MAPDILDLIEGAQDGNPEAARKLGDIVAEAIQRPDRRVGAALMPKKRGGVSEWQAEQAADRAEGYRKFAMAEYGTTLLTPGQASRLNLKLERMLEDAHFMEGGGTIQEQAVRQIRAAGGIVSDRHVLRLLSEPKKKL